MNALISDTVMQAPTSRTRNTIRGRVHLPGEAGFDDTVDQRVVAVVEAAGVDDIRALLRFAASAGIPVTTQPGGRTGGSILLRTGRLNEIAVDPRTRIARVGAGVRAGEVQAAASRHGLTGTPGSSPAVSVTGYLLGGGLGCFAREYGWAADHVRAFDVVDATGRPARVSADSDPDLFWALRGGGGDFAIVTAAEYALHPEPLLFGGRMTWPAERAAEVVDAFRAITADAPDELTVSVDLLPLRRVAVDATYLGEEATARDLLHPLDRIGDLISDSRTMTPITAEPIARAELLTDLDDVAVKTLLSAPFRVRIRHLGGALARHSDTPHGAVSEQYAVHLSGAIRDRQHALIAALGDKVTGRKPFAFLAPGESAAQAFSPDTIDRLRRIKRERDPKGVFRSNFPVLAR
ncbi:FAD-binding oxidoreductase [Nonomuraea sp. NPDC050556]|uniref:FAD-binding oxidoreductase n=1 Tax=Nonomuraea sp. NPDC050556 TaxID=3364369 RepID=UPI00379DF2E1